MRVTLSNGAIYDVLPRADYAIRVQDDYVVIESGSANAAIAIPIDDVFVNVLGNVACEAKTSWVRNRDAFCDNDRRVGTRHGARPLVAPR